ncbi:unnamed protein product [Cunninghamella echinulata]
MASYNEKHEDKLEYEVHTKTEFYDEQVNVKDADARSLPQEHIEESQFTWRATIVGSLLGCLVAASNTYLGLKIGWTFGASLFGAIFSFAILKPLSRALPPKWGGGYFGPKENCTAQSAATTAGGLSAGFVSGIPAMYKLGLLSTPRGDAAALVLFTISAAFYGLFFAVPLRSHFVVKQDLTFPTPRASATTIISLHDSIEGEKEAMKKAKVMAFWFALTFFWSLIGYWVPFFEAIHLFWWIGYRANYIPLMSADVTWRWFFKWDFPFFGAGLMTPGNTVLSFFIATLVIFGIIGPVSVENGSFVQPYGFPKVGVSSQTFFLWPGIALMVLTTFAELLVRYDTLWRGIKGGCISFYGMLRHVYYTIIQVVFRKELTDSQKKRLEADADPDEIFAPEELIPSWWWMLGTLISIIFTCAIMGEFFAMPVYQTIVAVILAFIFAFVGIQASGETDINPTGSIGKSSQLVFAGMPADSTQHLQKLNLMAGNISASAASQAVDMVGDLKTGQLVGASPKSQFWAQFVASFFAIGIAVGLFILFADAYPCVTAQDLDMPCKFELVAVMAWYKVTQLLTGSGESIAPGSMKLTIACAVIGAVWPFLRQFLIPEKYHKYTPSVSAIGIAMINTSPEIPIAMLLGWITTMIWSRISPDSFDKYMYSTAGGQIAGMGIAAIIQAVLTIAEVPQYAYKGSCPIEDGEHVCP